MEIGLWFENQPSNWKHKDQIGPKSENRSMIWEQAHDMRIRRPIYILLHRFIKNHINLKTAFSALLSFSSSPCISKTQTSSKQRKNLNHLQVTRMLFALGSWQKVLCCKGLYNSVFLEMDTCGVNAFLVFIIVVSDIFALFRFLILIHLSEKNYFLHRFFSNFDLPFIFLYSKH